MAQLSRLVGRGRALEILVGSDDIDADVAERYGYVNRALPDAELDGFVNSLARRIASFEREAIAETKSIVNAATLPSTTEFKREWDAFISSVRRPAAQSRIQALLENGFHKPGDVERHLGRYTAMYRGMEQRSGLRSTIGSILNPR
jgi:enoyl-CoA hydratase/carnithine racemase